MRKIIAALNLRVIDELQHRVDLKLIKIKPFRCGAMTLYDEPI